VPRLATLLAALFLALPGAAFAQGAGDDQYQDPFGDEPTQSQGDGDGGGLSDEPPVTDDDGGSAGSGGSGSDGSGGSAGAEEPSTGTAGAEGETATPSLADQLPRTGSDPWQLMLVGSTLLMIGVGLRLRTIDPDAY